MKGSSSEELGEPFAFLYLAGGTSAPLEQDLIPFLGTSLSNVGKNVKSTSLEESGEVAKSL